MHFFSRKILISVKRFLSIVFYFPLALILKIQGIIVPFFYVERIGHLVVDPDSFIKEHILNTKKPPKAILLAPKSKASNKALINYWKKYFKVIENNFLARLLLPLAFHPLTSFQTKEYTLEVKDTATSHEINSKWGDRPPLLNLEKIDLAKGKKMLKEIGLSDKDWFVCIHNRESGYSPSDDEYHSYRNIPLSNFSLAIEYISSQGGMCIRMGDEKMTPAPPIKGLFDYALSKYRSEIMDIFLPSQATFFLGTNSGAFELATLFGVPVAATNMAPLTTAPRGKYDLRIPMLLKDSSSGKLISFKRILGSNLANLRTTKEWQDAQVELIENTPEDILELTVEVIDRIRGVYSDDKESLLLNERFNSLIRPGHYCYRSSSQIGGQFLKKYKILLDD